jgi:crotonobetainyl-CoA:carnitine CoA-transferase CaiB-like acyl-CoA transferase
VKRSRSIRLVLIGGLSAGALTGCNPVNEPAAVSAADVYTNNYHVPGVGFYHAPFRAFYPMPYNYFDAKSGRYFYGGIWGDAAFQSFTNISSPTPDAVMLAQSQRTDIRRDGFGRTSGYRSTWS